MPVCKYAIMHIRMNMHACIMLLYRVFNLTEKKKKKKIPVKFVNLDKSLVGKLKTSIFEGFFFFFSAFCLILTYILKCYVIESCIYTKYYI